MLADNAALVQQVPKGAVIARENDPNLKNMFIVLRGNVGVYRNYQLANEEQTTVLSQGNFFGEMSMFLNQEYRQTLVALTEVVVLIVSRKNLPDFFAHQTDMAINITEGICRSLDTANKSLEEYTLANTEQKTSKTSKLFPKQHGRYTLPLNNASDLLYEEKCACPLCGHKFGNLTIIASKLQTSEIDSDMRVRYKNIEPLHYEIISCPNCFYSASAELFPTISKTARSQINKILGPYQLDMYINSGVHRDTFSVFAGYYLAILCAPSFEDNQAISAGLWLKLSRLYQDCGDNQMYLYASSEALKEYIYTYENLHVNEKQVQQICFMIGELYYRASDLDESRKFFFMAKTNKGGTATVKQRADMRLEEIREIIKKSNAAKS